MRQNGIVFRQFIKLFGVVFALFAYFPFLLINKAGPIIVISPAVLLRYHSAVRTTFVTEPVFVS